MTKFKQFLVPAVIILMGAGAAFATNAAKDSQSASVQGYRFDSVTEECIATKQCSTIPGDICTWTDPSTSVTYSLHNRISGTLCGNQQLYEPASH
ncbi:DUF6520 family protein [uncultured Proteiniphilum sp.]|uniref:DUF6520 family protein n=1 Tax=uncultured Proteiniphilum sp. TaxID=497637 RepID=UPI0026273B26|nr:DUF6520 family protein [uncultured Proteiniphilum sp.]